MLARVKTKSIISLIDYQTVIYIIQYVLFPVLRHTSNQLQLSAKQIDTCEINYL